MNVMTSVKMALTVTTEKVISMIQAPLFIANFLAATESPLQVHDDLDTAE